MDFSDTDNLAVLLCGVALLLGVAGVVVPVLPGLALCWAGVLIWAVLADRGWGKWLVLALVTAVAAVGAVIKYAWPGRRLKRTGVPNRSLIAGGLLGLVGFFAIPVLGLILGFVLGVWLAERARLGAGRAWPATRQALAAVGLAIMVELGTALTIVGVWIVGLVAA